MLGYRLVDEYFGVLSRLKYKLTISRRAIYYMEDRVFAQIKAKEINNLR
jgi:hypothetical protein